MNDRYSKRLLEHLGHDAYKPAAVAALATDLGVEPDEVAEFRESVQRLTETGRVEVDAEGKVRLPAAGSEIVGTYKRNPRGFGFVKPVSAIREGDIFIAPDASGDALSGDTVRIKLRRGTGRFEGELSGTVVEVVTRKRKVFSGELRKRGTQWLVYPDGRELTDPIVVRDPTVKNAKEGDKVVVELTAYPEAGMLPEGVITQVLGAAGLPTVETQAVIAAYNLPGEFPQSAFSQARRATDQFHEELERCQYTGWTDREDLRTSHFIATIDPPDAKDYDDAIHIIRKPDGWELGVHIADVANFIPVGSPLDEEAKIRGNSVYLPRLVIPMLPETLSNGICSLQEGVPRYCKSAFMQYDRQGNIRKAGVASTCIQSAKRLTYLEAQALIDGDQTEAKKHAKTEPNYTDELLTALREMDACARAIRQRRRAAGMIHLELPDVELIYDEDGHVVDAQKEDDAFTHTIIEMFMVEANEVLARLFAGLKVPLLRRVHPEPTPGDVDDLRKTAMVAGFTIPSKPTRQELQALLDSTRGTAAAPAVHFAVLRTLTRAEYSPALIGHFALASEAYAHFTSPIRRYPDLTVHRALAEYLKHTANGSKPPNPDDADARHKLGAKLRLSPNCPDAETLTKIGQSCSQTEANAASAEESLRSFLVLQLLSKHVGEDFPAMATGCNNAGVFIKLEKYLAEGLIKTADLPVGTDSNGKLKPGTWRLDQRTGRIVHSGTGRSFGVGDRVTVTIAKVDLALRRMDLVIADPSTRDRGKTRKVYPKAGYAGKASPTGPIPDTALGGGGLQLNWEQLKSGQSGSARRSQRSKQRGKGKNQRRDG